MTKAKTDQPTRFLTRENARGPVAKTTGAIELPGGNAIVSQVQGQPVRIDTVGPNPLQAMGGSVHPAFNSVLLAEVVQTLHEPQIAALPEGAAASDGPALRLAAAAAALGAFKPADEIEGMLAAQATALHFGAMECLRRAVLSAQPPDIASKLRKDGANLARAMTDMLDALDRKRGKGPQVVRVERVVVHEGGQAIVGNVQPVVGGGGVMTSDRGENPMQPDRRLANLTGKPNAAPRCGARTRAGTPCCQPAMVNRRCRMHGGASTGPRTPEGLERVRTARTIHGGYGADERKLRELVRELKADAKRLCEVV